MNASKHLGEKLRVLAQNKLLIFLAGSMLVVTVLNFFMLARALTYTRTIIVPMKVTRPMEFQGNDADDNTFRQTAEHIVSLAFSYSPATARTNFNDLLVYYDPDTYAKGKAELTSILDKVETAHVSSSYYPHRYVIDRKAQTIEVLGSRRVIAEDGSVPINEQKTYLLSYRMEDGKFLLRGIEEKASNLAAPATKGLK